eukprot:TRINITY_DN5353_c0_g1_i1.p1 TRINITY_DN5353_c0_g1~~TRINITY_DN5353_c0_g1_i1.p1  ORF type:complete len:140 (-),score=22.56 TRINITY_DN5353_c0_g1_i1:98-517(-)
MVKTYYRTAQAALLTYDVNNLQTFKNLGLWVGQIQQNASPQCLLYLVGNKTDLIQLVTKQGGQNMAKSLNVKFFETSAQNGNGVEELFQSLARDLQSKFGSGDHTTDTDDIRGLVGVDSERTAKDCSTRSNCDRRAGES